tara:strand:- start:182 stop:418 length:237 start_codon:yes stop_codon:yes gene_type:complete
MFGKKNDVNLSKNYFNDYRFILSFFISKKGLATFLISGKDDIPDFMLEQIKLKIKKKIPISFTDHFTQTSGAMSPWGR